MDKVAIVGNGVQGAAFHLEMHLPLMCLMVEGATFAWHLHTIWTGRRESESDQAAYSTIGWLVAKSWSVTVHTLVDRVVRLGVLVLSIEVCWPAMKNFKIPYSETNRRTLRIHNMEYVRQIEGHMHGDWSAKLLRMYFEMANGPLRGVVMSEAGKLVAHGDRSI